jgi:O-antigen/teichoic acid export membrane protein
MKHSAPKSLMSVLEGTPTFGREDKVGVCAESVADKHSTTVGARIFQNTIVQLGGRGLSLLLSTAASVLLARYLGRERMGEYGALYAYLGLYSFLATFCLEPILAREVSRRRSEATQIFHTGSMVALSFALAGTVLAPLLAPLFGYAGQLRWLVAVAALDLLILPPIRLPGIVFQVDMKQWFAVGIGLLRQVLWLAAIVLLALRDAAFYQVVIARLLCGVLEAFVFFKLSYRRGFLSGPRRFDWSEARRLLQYGYPMVLSGIAAGIFSRIDQVMLHKMVGARALGPYVVAVQLTEQFGALPVALISSLAPVLAVRVGQEVLFRHYLKQSYRFLTTVAFFLCAVITPITKPLIALLYGKEFLSSADLINVLVWSEVPLFLGVVVTHALIAKNLQRYFPISAAVGATMNIGLNLVFIPHWGALGASWATIISYTFAAVVMYLAFQPSRAIAWDGLCIAAPPFAVALVITFALRFWPVHFAVKCLAAVALYSVGAWLTGTVRKPEIDRLKEMIHGTLKRVRPEMARNEEPGK